MNADKIREILKDAISNQPNMTGITLDLEEQAGINALISAGMPADKARDTYWD
jgi:hypothetical protein